MPRSLTPTWSVIFCLVFSLIVLDGVVNAAELCTPTYCVCLGECPESYATAYNRYVQSIVRKPPEDRATLRRRYSNLVLDGNEK